MNLIETRILEAVYELKEDILDFTCRLVAEPSTLGNEASAFQVMEAELKKLSYSPVRIPVSKDKLSQHPGFARVPWSYDNRYNLVAIKEADASGGQSALFNGHLDVVSEQPISLWDSDPYSPMVKDGWLYGRGTGDMKAGVAAMTYAVEAFRRAGLGLRASVTIEAVIEEECGGNGALACLEAGYDAAAVLIPEPTDMQMMKGQLGILWFKVTLSGVPRHVAEAQSGVNAIEKCYPLIDSLRMLEKEMNQRIHPAYQDSQHPINLNIGIIKGGDWPSTVPGMAEFHCRLSFFPDRSYSDTCRQVLKAINHAAEKDPWLSKHPPVVEFYGFRSEGHVLNENMPILSTLGECHQDLFGKAIASEYSTGTTDVHVFHFFGQSQATCYGPVAENIHAANERVNIKSLIDTSKIYALFLAKWCGIVE